MKVKVTLVYWCKCGTTEYPHQGFLVKPLPPPHGRGKPREYRIIGTIGFCCREMEKAYDENFIRFRTIMNHPREGAIPIGCGLTIIRTRCFPELTSEEKMYIHYCPFCGKEVVVEGL